MWYVRDEFAFFSEHMKNIEKKATSTLKKALTSNEMAKANTQNKTSKSNKMLKPSTEAKLNRMAMRPLNEHIQHPKPMRTNHVSLPLVSMGKFEVNALECTSYQGWLSIPIPEIPHNFFQNIKISNTKYQYQLVTK